MHLKYLFCKAKKWLQKSYMLYRASNVDVLKKQTNLVTHNFTLQRRDPPQHLTLAHIDMYMEK